MTNWKVKAVHKNKSIEFSVKAKTYAEAYIKAQLKYPECRIMSIQKSASNENAGK
jgi:hypothetical protein